jgi:acetyl esterase/lipase
MPAEAPATPAAPADAPVRAATVAAPTPPSVPATTGAGTAPAPGSRRERIFAGLRKEGIEPNPELGDDQLALLLAHLQEQDAAEAGEAPPVNPPAAPVAPPASVAAEATAPDTPGAAPATAPLPKPAHDAPPPRAHVLPDASGPHHDGASALLRARTAFATRLKPLAIPHEALAIPPATAPFTVVRYAATPGPLAAYLSKDPGDGARHPAIVWITGGDCNSIDDIWTPQRPDNDQGAAQFRQAGVVMLFPGLRGGNDNPGQRESFYGEVDDVIDAGEYLATLPYVDPARIYLGGHSTGGTLALLVAESSQGFAGIFSFGPVRDLSGYGGDYQGYDTTNPQETALRSPIHWLDSIVTPTDVIEAARGNAAEAVGLAEANHNALLHVFKPIQGRTHFSVLAPTNRFLAAWVAGGGAGTISEADLDAAAVGGP